MAKTLGLFARTCRARQLYDDNNVALQRMRRDLARSFDDLLEWIPEISLRVRSDGFYFEDQVVLDEPNPDESIPFAYYRDGVRRLDFYRGLSTDELDVVIGATARGFSFTGVGDDIVANLWKHDLEHVRYVVVDTNIVDAAEGGAAAEGSAEVADIDAQLDGLLRAIYGESDDDVGPRRVNVDEMDLPAKALAETLDQVDDMAPGFHPSRTFLKAPAYKEALLAEIAPFDDQQLAMRAMFGCFWSLQQQATGPHAEATAEALLRMFDTAVVGGDLQSATYAIQGMTHIAQTKPKTQAWLDQAIDDARLRHVTQYAVANRQSSAPQQAFAFFRACGKRAVPSLVGQLAGLEDPTVRRAYAELVLELGIDDLASIRALMDSDQAYVAQEAIHLLGRIGTPEANEVLMGALTHPHAAVRLAFLDHLTQLPDDVCLEMCTKLLEDSDPRVQAGAAATLGSIGNPKTANVLRDLVLHPDFAAQSKDYQRACLTSYAKLGGAKAILPLSRFIKQGTTMLAGAAAEELAISSVLALSEIRSQRSVEVLKEACKTRKKRVRETAVAVLERMA